MTQVVVWSGWVGGLAIGAYTLLQLVLSGRALGVSTGFGNVCSLVSKSPFFHKGEFSDPTNWRLWFIIGLPLGGLIAVMTSPGATWSPSFHMGALYESVLPSALWAKGLVLMVGGVAIGYGSRMAGGCTSGHSIFGLALLNPPSIVASIGFFVGGIAVVQLLFNVL